MKNLDHWIVALRMTDADRIFLEQVKNLALKLKPNRIDLISCIEPLDVPRELMLDIPDLHLPDVEGYQAISKDLALQYLSEVQQTEIVVKNGNPVSEILNYARKAEADFLLLGKSSDEDANASLKKIARKSPCNVLLLSQEAKMQLENILVPTDFSEHADLAFDMGRKIASLYPDTKLHALHAHFDSSKYVNQVFETVYEAQNYVNQKTEMDQVIERHARHKLDQYLANFNEDNYKIKSYLSPIHKGEKVANVINTWIAAYEPDMVILGSKGQSAARAVLTGSVSEEVFMHEGNHSVMIMKKEQENMSFLKALLGN